MFKRGGSSYGAQGTGITSGLDQPRRRYGNGDFGQLVTQAKKQNVLPEDMHTTGFMRGVSTMGAYDPDNPRTIGQMIYDASSAKSKYIDPIEAAEKERGLNIANEEIRQAAEIEKQELINKGKLDVVTAEALARSGGKFMVLEVEKKLVELNTRKQEIDKQLKLTPDDQSLINERENVMLSLNQLQKNIDILSTMSKEGIDSIRDEFTKKILKERTNPDGSLKDEYLEKYGVLKKTRDGEPVVKDGKKQYEVYDETDILESDVQAKLVDFYTQLGYHRTPEARGGRVGLANSYPGSVGEAASMTETVDTPQGDMTVGVTENINQAPGDQQQGQRLTFDELRARLPVTISDEIVNLLATSEQALLEFANIRTQQDIDKFNQVYRVDLALPEEA